MNKAYLSIGSNLNDRYINIKKCISMLERSRLHILKQSSIYETEPVGNTDQKFFYNIVIYVQTSLKILDFFKITQDIELKMGRKQSQPRNSSRIIDIDILTFTDKIMNSDSLILPHPRLHIRKFVLIPWSEIGNKFIVPSHNKSVDTLLKNVKDFSKVCKLNI
tara:strand:+ start:138 stop:626 length:489 start_codon:yes stop_codon:yes gene_type:complete